MLVLTVAGNTSYINEENQADALRQYWEAAQAGDNTARLARVDKAPEPPPRPTAHGALSLVAQDRIQRDETWATQQGFQLPPPIYAPGTRVLALGDDNYRLERQRVENMPMFGAAADRITATIQGENREDLTVSSAVVSMTKSGTLLVADRELALEAGAFHQLANLADFGLGSRYLADKCDPELRAFNVNRQLRRSGGRKLTLRTRESGGRRAIYATVTPAYAAVDSHEVLAAVRGSLTDARTEMRYDGVGVRATALWMPDQVVDLAAGDVFKAGVRIETDDTGRGRIRITAVLWRNLCLNLIVIGEGAVETVAQVHRGDPERILETVAAGVDTARTKVADFLGAWGHARTVKIDPVKTLRAWVEERKLVLPGVRTAEQRDVTVEALLAAWRKEPGDTLADAVNAVTRAAHENPFWGVDLREEMERQASKLVLLPR